MKDNEELKPRGQKRVDVKTQVNMEFERFSGFISEYSKNISEGGMFIRTDTPQPIGSVFSFEFRLRDDIKLIQGWGEVAWIRDAAEANEDNPAGMGIKFIDLDEDSRVLIRRIVSTREKANDQDQLAPVDEGGASPPPKLTIESISDQSANDTAQPAESIASSIADELDAEDHEPIGGDLAEFAVGSDVDSKTERISDEMLSFDSIPPAQEPEALEELLEQDEMVEPNRRSAILFIIPIVLGVGAAAGYFFFKDEVMQLISPKSDRQVAVNSTPPVEPPVPVENVNEQPEVEPQANETAVPPAPPEEVQPVEPAVQASEPLPPAQAVTNIRLAESGAAGSIVEIKLNGGIARSLISMFEVDDPPPRLVVDIGKINKPYGKSKITVQDERLVSLRLGLHRNPDKLRIVFDLKRKLGSDPRFEVVGDTVRVYLN